MPSLLYIPNVETFDFRSLKVSFENLIKFVLSNVSMRLKTLKVLKLEFLNINGQSVSGNRHLNKLNFSLS